jgi:excisionase family DNA binding protein
MSETVRTGKPQARMAEKFHDAIAAKKAIAAKERLAWKPEELIPLLGLSKTAVYEALANGTIPSVRVGRRYVIPANRLDEWLAGEDS